MPMWPGRVGRVVESEGEEGREGKQLERRPDGFVTMYPELEAK